MSEVGSTRDNSHVNTILRHQRAELGSAERWYAWAIAFQVLTASVAAASVFVSDSKSLGALAGGSVVLGCLWFWTSHFYRSHRAAGDQARRIVLVTSGLNQAPSDLSLFVARFGSSTEGVDANIDEYFVSRAPPGYRRIAEMIDESAFYTLHLQRTSGFLSLMALAGTLLLIAVLAILLFPVLPGDVVLIFARLFFSILVLLLSADFIGRVFGHYGAAVEMERIRLRLVAVRAQDYPAGDVVLLMSDYNACVEAAPMTLPGVYRFERGHLNRIWDQYRGASSFAA